MGVMKGIYHTDIRHFLDEHGEIGNMAPEGKSLASFLALLIDMIAQECPENFVETGVRCRTKGCKPNILARVDNDTDEIVWHCPKCGHNGVIRNWRNTKWDRSSEVGQGDY